MGLDMYLEKRTYIGNQFAKKGKEKEIKTPKKLGIKKERISEITEQVGYWRKANAIHKWFIKNCNNGDDDNGKDIYVSEDYLRALLDICKQVVAGSELVSGKITNGYSFENGERVPNLEDGLVIKDATIAKMLLPTCSGFFFGGTDYDEWYLEDIKNTIAIIEPLLAENLEHASIYYHPSW